MRISGLDVVRVVAVFAIVNIHIFPAPPEYFYLKLFVNQAARFAVPFFFVASGFLYAQRIHRGVPERVALKKSIGRILPIYLFWSAAYFLNPPPPSRIPVEGLWSVYLQKGQALVSDLEQLLLVGPGPHLWFLVSLLLAVVAFHILRGYKRKWFILSVAAGLYVVGVLGQAYDSTGIGFDMPINTRNFIFFSLLPFSAGYYLYGLEGRWVNLWFGLFLWLGGTALHFFEIFMLAIYYGKPILSHDYVFSTILMGIGAFIVARSNAPMVRSPVVAKLGRLALGIYCAHLLVVYHIYLLIYLFFSIFPDRTAWMIAAPLLTFTVAALVSYLLSKFALTRRIVT